MSLLLFPARFAGNTGGVDGQQGGDVQSGGTVTSSSVVVNAVSGAQQGNAGGAGNTNNNATGAGAWGDEIDFDLNNDLASNGYMK